MTGRAELLRTALGSTVWGLIWSDPATHKLSTLRMYQDRSVTNHQRALAPRNFHTRSWAPARPRRHGPARLRVGALPAGSGGARGQRQPPCAVDCSPLGSVYSTLVGRGKDGTIHNTASDP